MGWPEVYIYQRTQQSEKPDLFVFIYPSILRLSFLSIIHLSLQVQDAVLYIRKHTEFIELAGQSTCFASSHSLVVIAPLAFAFLYFCWTNSRLPSSIIDGDGWAEPHDVGDYQMAWYMATEGPCGRGGLCGRKDLYGRQEGMGVGHVTGHVIRDVPSGDGWLGWNLGSPNPSSLHTRTTAHL